jgi:hypothetical protein
MPSSWPNERSMGFRRRNGWRRAARTLHCSSTPHHWVKRERAKLSRHNDVAKAIDYMLRRIEVFTRFLEDGRICQSNNAAERELRRIALGLGCSPAPVAAANEPP